MSAKFKENITLSPSSSTLGASEVLVAPIEQFLAAIAPFVEQIKTLCRKSIRDYDHFLAYYACGLKPFSHPIGNLPAETEESSPTSSPPSSPSLVVRALVKHPVPQSISDFVTALSAKSTYSQAIRACPRKHFPHKYHNTPVNREETRRVIEESMASEEERRKACPLCTNASKEGTEEKSGGDGSGMLGTYHPLLVEAWYAIGLNYMLLGDWKTCLLWHGRIINMQELVEGYPIFLPARSMSQADYIEVIRLLRANVRVNEGMMVRDKEERKTITDGSDGKKKDECEVEAAGGKALTTYGDPQPLPPRTKKHYPLHTKRAETLMVWLQRDISKVGTG
ncbi:hypothetical protein HDV05_002858, partial [Chytridiales sp. JEL 0842]